MNTTYRKFFLATSIVILALALLPALALADLPTRPEDVPTPKSQPPKAGAGIELSVTGATESYDAVVQWQDGLGEWHDVDGWRGQVEDDHVLWFVSEDLLGAGPFRWLVYTAEGRPLGSSESFDMPLYKGTITHVTIAL
ncbi:MAG: hypothetical protein JXA89_27040 [Anaerolineae bacterium]|nr:hypothetical protein [Anaerolineae bacterium]